MDWGDCVKGVNKVATLDCVPLLFQNIVNGALLLAGVVALFFIIYSGIKIMLSGGEAKEFEGARKTLTYAILGLIVILLSFFIINFLSFVTNVGCIQKFGFTNCK